MIQEVAPTLNVPTIAAPVAQAVQAPFGVIQHRLDAHVWAQVAKDASSPAVQQVAEAMLAASQGGTVPPHALAGAGVLAPGAPGQQLPAVAGGLPAVPGGVPAVIPVAPPGGVVTPGTQAAPPAPAGAPGTAGPVAATPAGASPQANEVVQLVNQARAAKGLPPVTLDAKLVQVAAAHSQHMAKVGKMAHEGIGNGSPTERIRKALPTAKTTAENVAYGQRSAAEVMQGWMDSPGHRRNILDPNLRTIGVEVVTGSDGRPYWTQVFTG